MDRRERLLAQPPPEFVNVLTFAYPMIVDRYVARGIGAAGYMVEVVPGPDQPVLRAYLDELLDGEAIDNSDLREFLNRNSAWWSFETKCARTFLEGLRGSLIERMRTNA